MSSIEDLVQIFNPVSLTDIKSSSLMNRVDMKYIFHEKKLPQILENLSNNYNVLEINDKRWMEYNTLYFDTPLFSFYHRHYLGFTKRHKVRYRQYVQTGDVFLELKLRNNQGRMLKKRIQQKEIPMNLSNHAIKFLQSKAPEVDINLHPTLWVGFKRLTLVNKNSKERVTIDIDLEVKLNGKENKFTGLVIAESKQEINTLSDFIIQMKNEHIGQVSLSKYCLGIASLSSKIKKQRFLNSMMKINKIVKESEVKK